jgi:hypothetical protein
MGVCEEGEAIRVGCCARLEWEDLFVGGRGFFTSALIVSDDV